LGEKSHSRPKKKKRQLNRRHESSLKLELLRLLPGEVGIRATKVTKRSSLLINRTTKLKITGKHTRTKIKVVENDADQLLIGLDTSAVSVNIQRQRLRDTDAVADLDKAALAELSSNEGLGDPTSSISTRTIDLARILARECTTTVSTPATISINDDLTASHTSITLRTTDDETARGIDEVDGLVVDELTRDDLVDDLLTNDLAELLVGDRGIVLSGDNDSVDTPWDEVARALRVLLVLDGDLRLHIRTKPLDGTVLTGNSESLHELGGQSVSHGHHLRGLISGITEHVALITSTDVLVHLTVLNDALGDISALLSDGDEHGAALVVEALVTVIITDLLDGPTDELIIINDSIGSDLTKNHDHTSLGSSLTSDTRVGILSKASIKHSIRHLIAELVGVTLRNTLTGEKDAVSITDKLRIIRL